MGSMLQAAFKEPLLTIEIERDAIRRWQDEGDRSALDLLVRSHLRQVWSQARRFSSNSADLDDLVAEGTVGLMRAADSFDLELNLRFSTYAAYWVKNGVFSALSQISTVIDVPDRVLRAARTGRQDETDTGLSLLATLGTLPLDAGGEGLSLSEQIPCGGITPAEMFETHSAQSGLSQLLADAIAPLDPTDQEIIKRRRLAAEPECAETVAQDLGMSAQRLKQTEARALNRLRRNLLAHGFTRAMLH